MIKLDEELKTMVGVDGVAPMKYMIVDCEKTMGRYKVLFFDLPVSIKAVMDGVSPNGNWVWVCLDRWLGSSGYAFSRGGGQDNPLSVDYVMEKLNIHNRVDATEITKIIADELGRTDL